MPENASSEVVERALERLMATVDGDLPFVRELTEQFLADAPGQLDAIDAALAAGDAGALLRPAHTLKSTSQMFGAEGLAGLAGGLEGRARQNRLDGAEDEAVNARTEFDRSAAALRDVLRVLETA